MLHPKKIFNMRSKAGWILEKVSIITVLNYLMLSFAAENQLKCC